MDFTFENIGTNTFLVYEIKPTDVVDNMSLGMITNNKISGLAQTQFMQIDTKKYVKYNVSSKISVRQFFTGSVNKKRLLGVFTGIVDAMLSAEEYMIDPAAIVFDLEYIFSDVSTCDTVLVCLPLENKGSVSNDLGSFFKNIMFSTQFEPTENCDYVAKIINYLNSAPMFSLEDFKKVLEECSGVISQAMPPQMAPQAPMQQPTQPQVAPQMVQPMPQVPAQPVMQQPMTPPLVANPVNVPNNKKVAPQQMNIPTKANGTAGQPAPLAPEAPNVGTAAKGEKGMSMFSLLCHYSKENAEIYKAQKQERKAAEAAKKAAGKQSAEAGFAVPNQPQASNVGFAVPGMPNVAPAPMGVPPQKAPEPAKPQMPNVAPMSSTVSVPVSAPVIPPMPQAPVQPVMPQQAPSQPMANANFGETTVLGVNNNIGETTVLGLASVNTEVKAYLVRTKNNERIIIDKPVFRIGKEKSYVDYFISDNTAISRSHANVVTKDGKYYIVDTNSTNHTYINNTMLQSNVETELTHGTRIKLANEEFEFILA